MNTPTRQLMPFALGMIAILVGAACKDDGPTFGAIRVSVATTGGDVDLDGYTLSLDGSTTQAIDVNGTARLSNVPTGSHEVALANVAHNCAVSDGNSRALTIRGGQTADVAFAIACVATGVEVTVATGGLDTDPDGYAVSVGNAPPLRIPVNGSVRITRLSPGTHTVTLSGLVGNCGAPDETIPRSVDVPAGEVVPVAFTVTCSAVHGVVEITAATSGGDLDPNGYTVQLDGGAPQPLLLNGTVRFSDVHGGEHTVTLAGMANNCPVSGDNPRTVSVTIGRVTRDTARTTFQVTCHWLTGIAVIIATSGSELDDTYLVGVDYVCYYGWYGDYCEYLWRESASANDTVRFATVPVGDHAVYLEDIAPNCRLAAANPSPATVLAGHAAIVTLAVTCERSGSVRVSATTTGADLDPDGYSLLVQGAGYTVGSYVGTNASVTIAQLPAGEYSVTLSGLTANCAANGQNPVTVTVVAGATVDVAFAVTCAALGSIQLTAVTTGVDLDTDGYSVRVQRAGVVDQSYGVGPNGTVTISGLAPGHYVVSLRGAALNCAIRTPNPQTVAVPSEGTAVVQLDVVCAASAQLAVVIASDGDEEIYLVKTNRTGLTRLTTNTVADVQPAWSPDGAMIAFATNLDGNFEIYVMNADGQNRTRRTAAPGADYSPAWSPDGSKIVFTSERDGNAEIYVMDADGSNPIRLTNHSGSDTDPAWSPDGSQIAFSSTRDGNAEIYVMDATGSGMTRLTVNNVDDVQPAWSPDGTKLAFSRFAWCDSYSGFCDYDLFVMNANASGAAPLLLESSDSEPAWSPDGRWIAYGASFCSNGWYYVCYHDYSAVQLVRADGTGVFELVRGALQPAWRP